MNGGRHTDTARYVELQGIPEIKRSLIDLVRIKMFENYHDTRAELNSLKRQRYTVAGKQKSEP